MGDAIFLEVNFNSIVRKTIINILVFEPNFSLAQFLVTLFIYFSIIFQILFIYLKKKWKPFS